jgi:hypothetical protein
MFCGGVLYADYTIHRHFSFKEIEMDITVFDDFPTVDFKDSISFDDTDFIELKPILDLCRVHNKVLLISFKEEEE